MHMDKKLTLTLPVEQIRAALETHDEHEALERVFYDFELSPCELGRLRQLEAEVATESMWQAEEARHEWTSQCEWIAANLRRIAEGSSAGFPSAWFYARAYLDLRRGEGDDACDTDSLENWIEVVQTGVSRHSVEDVRHAIQTIADCAAPSRRTRYVTVRDGQSQ